MQNSFKLDAGDEICFNISRTPLNLAFIDIPVEMSVYFYRILEKGGLMTLDWNANTSNLSYSIRSIHENSSYTIQAHQTGNYTIGASIIPECPDGTLVLTTPKKLLNFTTHSSDDVDRIEFFDLNPGDQKCVLIMNYFSTIITVNMSVNPQKDFLYHYIDSVFYNSFTADTETPLNVPNLHPFLLKIFINSNDDYNKTRYLRFAIQKTLGSSIYTNKELFFGRYRNVEATPRPPIPECTTQYVWKVDITWLSLLASSFVLFVVLLIVLLRRTNYKLPHNSKKGPVPPSHFLQMS